MLRLYGLLKKRKVRFTLYICISMLVIIVSILSLDSQVTVKMIYNDYEENDMLQDNTLFLVFEKEKGIAEHMVKAVYPQKVWGHYFEVYYDVPQESGKLANFHLNLLCSEEISGIKSIEIYQDNLQVLKLAPEQIIEQFQFSMEPIQSGGCVKVSGGNGKTWMEAKEPFLENYQNSLNSNWRAWANCVLYGIIILILLYGLDRIMLKVIARESKSRENEKKFTNEDIFLLFILTFICFSAIWMALWSEQYSHSDEYATKMGIDYYLGNWLPPSRDSNWVAGTFSYYGVTRLMESTWYYFVAGKIGWLLRQLFNINTYYRFSNVICLGIMLFACWKYRKKQRWMYLALCITPQLWYLFSYGTSDAWDYFWGFWIIFLLLYDKSILNKIVNNCGSILEQGIEIVFCALIFSMIFLGKTNYLVILGLAFVDLLIKLLQVENGYKLRLLGKYMIILFLTFLFVHMKENLVNLNEDYEPIAIVDNMEEIYAQDMTKTKDEGGTTGLVLHDREYTLADIMFRRSDISLLRTLYTSMIGVYATHSAWSGRYYLLAILLAYFFLGILWLRNLGKSKEWAERIKLFTIPVWFFAMTVIVVLYCWYVDYQPQGRYMLPVYLVAAYAFGSSEGLADGIWSRILQYVCTLLSLYSFWFVGIASVC